MAFDVHSLKNIQDFYQAISPWESGYQNNSFTYVAVQRNSSFVIVQGALWLNASPRKTPLNSFSSENVRAGHFQLSDLGMTFRDVVSELGKGSITTPQGNFLFTPKKATDHHGAYFTPLHPSALQAQSRINVLKLAGEKQLLTREPSVLDWELRSSTVPFDSIHELLSEYGVGGLFDDAITIEVIASAVMGFEGDTSKISGETAHINIRLANTLDIRNASVGYREINQGRVKRGVLAGEQFSWKQTDEMQIGSFDLTVEKAAILHCYAIYSKVAQTHWFITDPTTSQNSRRVVVETFDPGLAILTEFMGRSRGKSYDARDLEVAVAWMFWMLGFSTVQLGSTARTQDFSDVVLVTPQGHLAIVECTIGLLKAGDKLAKLVARYVMLRDRLDKSNNRHLKLLPIMVSPLPRAELQADLEQAERLGVLVLAREQLDQIVPRTVIGNNPDELFQEAEKRIQSAQDAFRAKGADPEPELPL